MLSSHSIQLSSFPRRQKQHKLPLRPSSRFIASTASSSSGAASCSLGAAPHGAGADAAACRPRAPPHRAGAVGCERHAGVGAGVVASAAPPIPRAGVRGFFFVGRGRRSAARAWARAPLRRSRARRASVASSSSGAAAQAACAGPPRSVTDRLSASRSKAARASSGKSAGCRPARPPLATDAQCVAVSVPVFVLRQSSEREHPQRLCSAHPWYRA